MIGYVLLSIFFNLLLLCNLMNLIKRCFFLEHRVACSGRRLVQEILHDITYLARGSYAATACQSNILKVHGSLNDWYMLLYPVHFVGMCIYIYIHTYTCVCVYLYIYIHMCAYVYNLTYMY